MASKLYQHIQEAYWSVTFLSEAKGIDNTDPEEDAIQGTSVFSQESPYPLLSPCQSNMPKISRRSSPTIAALHGPASHNRRCPDFCSEGSCCCSPFCSPSLQLGLFWSLVGMASLAGSASEVN